MAVLIPALGACLSRMTSGEKCLAERLEQKLDADYMLRYDVPVGPKQTYPDFVVIHPRRGLLILETKDWRLETIQRRATVLGHETLLTGLRDLRHFCLTVNSRAWLSGTYQCLKRVGQ